MTLRPAHPSTIAEQILLHALLLWLAVQPFMSLFVLVLLLAAEIVLISALTAVLYPARGLRRHAIDIAKVVFSHLLIVTLVTALYLGASGTGSRIGDPVAVAQALAGQFQRANAGWILAYAGAHLLLMLLRAMLSPTPRLRWARTAIAEGAASLLALLGLLLLLGALLILSDGGLPDGGDGRLPWVGVVLVVLRLGFALLVHHLPDSEWAQIARTPYQG